MSSEELNVCKICGEIKSLKIQGATNVAIAALDEWYSATPKNKKMVKKQLLLTRPTEPLMWHILDAAERGAKKQEIINYIKTAEEKIAEIGAKLIKNNSVIFTHCHSSTVMRILKKAKDQGKKFEVYNTEARPLYQGRVTAKELADYGIPIKHFVDSAAMIAMRSADLVLVGADAITPYGVYNKIGTGVFAEIAATYFKIPVYSCSISLKYAPKVIVEQRDSKEIWANKPKKVNVYNPAFELVEKKFLTGIITELGIIKPNEIVKKIRNTKTTLVKQK